MISFLGKFLRGLVRQICFIYLWLTLGFWGVTIWYVFTNGLSFLGRVHLIAFEFWLLALLLLWLFREKKIKV
jgi:hypothetical protein